jgi:NitT/TauT family transport system substrate-binding protein
MAHRHRPRGMVAVRTLLGLALGLLAGTFRLAPAAGEDLVRVGDVGLVSAGAFYIARDKGYFHDVAIKAETVRFISGATAVPSLIAGDIEFSIMPAAAGLFNSVAKGAPLVVILDAGTNKPGFGVSAINVSPALYAQGLHTVADFAMLRGRKIAIGAVGSGNQFIVAQALLKARLDPDKDIVPILNMSQPDEMKLMGQQQVDAAFFNYQLAMDVQNQHWGPVAATSDQIAPDSQVSTYAVRKDFLEQHRDIVVRFAAAYLRGVKEFDAAAVDPGHHPDVVAILAKSTVLNKPEIYKAIAPHWSYISDDGIPNIDSMMAIQDFWAGPPYHYIEKKVARDQLFDVSIAKEAAARDAAAQANGSGH